MARVPVPGALEEALAAVTAPLRERGMRYMLVGALGVFAHGEPRTTRDLDLVVDGTTTDVERLGEALRAARFPVEGPERTEFGLRYLVLHPAFPVEVFLSGTMETHAEEFRRSVVLRFGASEHSVISKEDLLARKLMNLRLRRSSEDVRDIKSVLDRHWDDLDFDYVRTRASLARMRLVFDELVRDVARERQKGHGP